MSALRVCSLTLALLVAPSAFAQRGLFNVSLQSGQVVGVAPRLGVERAVPLLGTLEYGLSERWSLSGSAASEFAPGGTTVAIALGPRLTLLRTTWWTVQALLTPEVLWLPPERVDLGLRAGFSVRYQLLWGVGVQLEAGVRGRAAAAGQLAPSLQGFLVGGLFIEA